MGFVKLLGTAIKTAGAIVEKSDLEDWLTEKGREYLEEYIEDQGVNRLNRILNRKKYKREFAKKIIGSFESNSLDASVKNYLKEVLPDKISSLVHRIEGLPVKGTLGSVKVMKSVPKGLFLEYFKFHILDTFSSASEFIGADLDVKVKKAILIQLVEDYFMSIEKTCQKDGIVNIVKHSLLGKEFVVNLYLYEVNSNQIWPGVIDRGTYYFLITRRIDMVTGNDSESMRLFANLESVYGKATLKDMDRFISYARIFLDHSRR